MSRAIDGDALFCKFWSLANPFVKQDKVFPSQVWNQAATMAREAPTLTPLNWARTVTEFCPHCENEITMMWDVETRGYKAYCPVCGGRLMLCDECFHGEPGYSCDYSSETDTCRHNKPKVWTDGEDT